MSVVNDKKKQRIAIFIKLLVAVGCLFLLIGKINASNLLEAFKYLASINPSGVILLSLAIGFLLLLNISIETLKWRLFTHEYGGSVFNSFQQVLGGIAGGFISPNRVGDPFTRSYLLPASHRLKGLLPATFCTFSQLLATSIFGSLALIHISSNTLPSIIRLTISQLIIVALVILLIWFAMRFFENRAGRIRFGRAILVVGLSLVRYFVFCTELWVIFLFFSTKVDFEPMFFAMALTFLANAAIPSFSVTELGVRAAGASIFFPMFGIDSSVAVMSTVFLWFVNMVIPSIPGLFLLISNNVSLSELKIFNKIALRKQASKAQEL